MQVLLTVCWHLTSGLPLRWTTSASHGSERRNAAEMLDHLPRHARMIGDAEYVGYPLWSKIHNSGRSFLVRVGSNVTLLENLGSYRLEEGLVYYWPEGVMDKNDPPIVLRLFQIHDGKKAIYLVTNELDLSYEMACELYAARWKLEVFFRTVKQTCEQAKLHCLRPENAILKDESDRTSSKASRNYPRKKAHQRCGPPIINTATHEQRQRAKMLRL